MGSTFFSSCWNMFLWCDLCAARTMKCAVSSRSFCPWVATTWSSVLSPTSSSSLSLSPTPQRFTDKLGCWHRRGPKTASSTLTSCRIFCNFLIWRFSTVSICSESDLNLIVLIQKRDQRRQSVPLGDSSSSRLSVCLFLKRWNKNRLVWSY